MNPRQSGLSLLELLLSLAMGLLLASASLHLYLGARQAGRSQAALAQVQDTGGLATALLAREIRHAGYRGSCLSTPNHHLPAGLADEPYRFDSGVQAWSTPPAWLGRSTVSGDVLLLRHARAPADDTTSGTLLLASDALGCDLFQSQGGRTPMPGTIPRRGQALLAFSSTAYFIEPGVSGLPALKRMRFHRAGLQSEELVDGVWSVQFRFALSGQAPRAFVGAGQVDDWKAVTAVLIRVWVISQETDIIEPGQSLRLAGQELQPPQRRLARVFQQSIHLRNPWP